MVVAGSVCALSYSLLPIWLGVCRLAAEHVVGTVSR